MDREDVLLYVSAISAGAVGTLVAGFLGWSETAIFVAGMGPASVVMLIFMRRERRQGSVGRASKAATDTRA